MKMISEVSIVSNRLSLDFGWRKISHSDLSIKHMEGYFEVLEKHKNLIDNSSKFKEYVEAGNFLVGLDGTFGEQREFVAMLLSDLVDCFKNYLYNEHIKNYRADMLKSTS